MSRKIYCCGCAIDVLPRLTDGKEIYPNRRDMSSIPFWKCDSCGNYVGCHHKTANKTRPLGCIPTPSVRIARQKIHSIIDPLWRFGNLSRSAVYKAVSKAIGKQFHTAEIRSVKEAAEVVEFVKALYSAELNAAWTNKGKRNQ
jgi:hypothetical protein